MCCLIFIAMISFGSFHEIILGINLSHQCLIILLNYFIFCHHGVNVRKKNTFVIYLVCSFK